MRKSISFWMLGIAAMLTSCSQNEDLLQGENNEKASKVTFSVNIDTGMQTRAVTDANDETPTRCVVGWYTQGGTIQRQEFTVNGTSFSVTVPDLEAETEYTFIFWADGGSDAYDASDLTQITRGNNPSIAFRNSEVVTITPNSETPKDVTLTHAVAKVVAKQVDNNLTADDKIGFSFEMPDYSYNAQTNTLNEATGNITVSSETTVSETLQGELLSAYVFAPSGETGEVIDNVNIWYEPTGKTEKYETAITNAPLKQNYRTVLTGDFSSLHAGMTFTANIEKQWEDDIYPNEIEGNIITVNIPGTLTDSEIATALAATGNDDAKIVVKGEMNSTDFNTLAYYNSNNENKRDNADNTNVLIIDLSEATGLTEIPEVGASGVNSSHFKNVQKLILPKTCTKIGYYAFQYSGILGIEGVGVTGLYTACFNNSSLEEAYFPSVTYIGTYAFQSCENLKTLKLTAAGTFDATKNRRTFYNSSTENITLYLNPDKAMDAENDVTPKQDSKTSWLSCTFKEIIFEEPSVTE